MLDLNKLSAQLRHASFELSQEAGQFSKRIQYALKVWHTALSNDHLLVEKMLNAPQPLPWPMARPLESLATKVPLPEIPQAHTVVATDGSQIAPSHHEISLCYLINVGKIAYYYGTGEIPIQESEPFFYYREKELYTQFGRQKFGVSENMIGIERSLREIEELASLCEQVSEKEYPAIAMIDGALNNLYSDIQTLPGELQEGILKRYITHMNRIQTLNIPICGYISQSRRNEVIQFLRLQLCPFEEAHCDRHCAAGEEACNGIIPMIDRILWSELLAVGERSPVFASTVRSMEKFEEHETCFFYLNTGHETARIEIPRWVADRPQWVARLQALCQDQVTKGFGYPVALSEAHNRAVIRGADRAQFYAMLSRKMVEKNMRVAVSNKELRKRRGVV